MPTLISTAAFLNALQRARRIDLCAYSLAQGSVQTALIAAATRGAEVSVTLAGPPCVAAGLALANEDALARLRSAGVHTREIASPPGEFHAKLACVDDALYLDDRNWSDAGDSIIRDTSATDREAALGVVSGRIPQSDSHRRLALKKHDALAQEEALLRRARRGSRVEVSTESFGFSPQIYPLLAGLARRGVRVELLAARSDSPAGSRAALALQNMAESGVEVRLGVRSEKMACVGSHAWIGSANATFARPGALDWGLAIHSISVVSALAQRFRIAWEAARPYPAVRSAGNTARAVASVRAIVSSSDSESSVASRRAVNAT